MKAAQKNRLAKLFQLFPKNGVDALLVSSWPNVSYISGFKGTESWVLVSPKGNFFITDSRYSEQAQSEAPGFTLILRDKKPLTQIVEELCNEHGFKRLGFEEAIVTHLFFQALQKRVGADRLVGTQGLIESQRIIKDAEEIKLIQKAADIAVKGYHYIKKTAKPGMSEREAQGKLE